MKSAAPHIGAVGRQIQMVAKNESLNKSQTKGEGLVREVANQWLVRRGWGRLDLELRAGE